MGWLHNVRHIGFPASLSATYDTVLEWFQGRDVFIMPFNEADLSANAQYILIDATNFAGTISLGTTSVQNGGWNAAALAGAVGTAATTSIADSEGHKTNLVEVRDAASHDPILDSAGRKVIGLLQAASTVADGDAVGAAASENLQVSFVVIAADGTVTLTSVTATIEIALPKMYKRMNWPSYRKAGMTPLSDIIAASTLSVRKFVVTAAFAVDEVITLSTGAGSVAGTSTPSGDTISSIGVDAATFIATNTTRIRIYGAQLTKTTAMWGSATSFQTPVALDVGDEFEVEISG
jgi:hypothetical protein